MNSTMPKISLEIEDLFQIFNRSWFRLMTAGRKEKIVIQQLLIQMLTNRANEMGL